MVPLPPPALGPDPAPATDNFGISVALFGPIAVIGAHRDDGQGADAGATYVFSRRGDAAFAMEGTVNAGIDMPRSSSDLTDALSTPAPGASSFRTRSTIPA